MDEHILHLDTIAAILAFIEAGSPRGSASSSSLVAGIEIAQNCLPKDTSPPSPSIMTSKNPSAENSTPLHRDRDIGSWGCPLASHASSLKRDATTGQHSSTPATRRPLIIKDRFGLARAQLEGLYNHRHYSSAKRSKTNMHDRQTSQPLHEGPHAR
ncbi:hypothetical protein EK21DRAFT_85371 [Setomelanomma holmii]|uniref:Uncharacterized protein n=1 Tax=Setomelanomma holmii TaxID=210430 RepID=A0A9P4LQJ5_9PLEO|nr:hypothetical protein EK21DRAFT_85371 [Setomelanomma holmii]